MLDIRRGNRLLAEALGRTIDRKYVRRATRLLDQAIAVQDEPSAELYLNLGIGYYLLREEDPGAVSPMVRAWEDYLRIAPSGAPQRALVTHVLTDPRNAEIPLGVR